MPEWSTACEDWEERITAQPQRSLITFPPLFPAEAKSALDIFGSLRIVDTAGRPTFGEMARPWIMDFVASIFGAYDAETGRRLIQYFFMLISKKNGKSTLAAGIMVTALVRNWRESGEFYILAPTKEIADNSYKPARDMVMADPDLRAILKPSAGRVIEHRNTGAFLKVIAADNETVSGKKTIGLLVDELHVFGKRPHADSMLLEATGGLASRPEGFVIYLSTQSDAIPAGVFKQKLQEFRQIRDGELEAPNRLGVLYEFPKAMQKDQGFRDPSKWYISNPNLGASVSADYIVDKLAEADRDGKSAVTGVLAKHLNVEIGLGHKTDQWAGADYWVKRTDPTLTKDELLARSEVVIPGIDGGGLDDLLGFCLLGRDRETKEWLAWSRGWCHRGVLERRKSIASLLADFAKAEELTIVDDDPLVDQLYEALSVENDALVKELRGQIRDRGFPPDIAGMVEIIEEVQKLGLLAEVAVDPAGLGLIVDALDAIGITQENGLLAPVRQGYPLMNAIKYSERKLANGTFWHCPSGLMSWCVSNVKIEPTATAIRATKQNAGDAKIDLWAAMIDAVDRMALNPVPNGAKRSYLETEELLVI